MKRLVLIAALFFASAAQAEQLPDWQQKLINYQSNVTRMTMSGLHVRQAFYITKAIATCAASTAVTAAAFTSDTIPLGNILGETIANISDPDYQTYEALLDWETLANLGRGAAGGAVVGVAEALEYVTLWLGGNEEEAWAALAKNYESSLATANALFAEQGQCMMNLSKVMLTRKELAKRRSLQTPELKPDAEILLP